jgi:hypothetical protein
MNETLLVTDDSREWRLIPVSTEKIRLAQIAVEKKYRDRGEPLSPPTYTVELPNGGEETHVHDEVSIEQVGDPEVNKEAWNAYKRALSRLTYEKFDVQLRLFMQEGIDIDEEFGSPKWEEAQKGWGIEIPEGPAEKCRHFLLTEVLKTPDDMAGFMRNCLKLSQKGDVDEEAVEAFVQFFRNLLSFTSGRHFRRRDAATRTESGEGPLDAQPGVLEVDDGEGVGTDPEPV